MPGHRPVSADRGQSNLIAVAAAIVVLSALTVASFAVVDTAFENGDRPAETRHAAVALSERVVAPGSPLTARGNVLDQATLDSTTLASFRSTFSIVGSRPVLVTVGEERVVDSGDVVDGVTVRRIVLVRERQAVTSTLRGPPAPEHEVTLPRRTDEVTVTVNPTPVGNVTTVRANGRVVLHNASGLDGSFTVPVPRSETLTLRIAVDGTLSANRISVTYYPESVRKAELAVTVDG